jgi:hypothetical protein
MNAVMASRRPTSCAPRSQAFSPCRGSDPDSPGSRCGRHGLVPTDAPPQQPSLAEQMVDGGAHERYGVIAVSTPSPLTRRVHATSGTSASMYPRRRNTSLTSARSFCPSSRSASVCRCTSATPSVTRAMANARSSLDRSAIEPQPVQRPRDGGTELQPPRSRESSVSRRSMPFRTNRSSARRRGIGNRVERVRARQDRSNNAVAPQGNSRSNGSRTQGFRHVHSLTVGGAPSGGRHVLFPDIKAR